jgi:UPF0755 protein
VILFLALAGCVDADAPLSQDASVLKFDVPPGSAASTLGDDLVGAGLNVSEMQWKMFLRGADGSCLKAGTFELRKNMSLTEVLTTLCGPPLPDDVPFTVVEGWRIADVDAALVEKGWIEAGQYASLALGKKVDVPFEVSSPTLEGYLWPETYMVRPPPAFASEDLIARQLGTFKERFLDTHELGERSLHDVVVMASMLEREEPKPSQRPMTAGILWKRIDNGWQLGVDATSRYELVNWNDRKAFLVKLRDPADPYNTRIHKGLPPTAIGSPTLSSLEAALEPVDSPFWFYLHDGEGNFHGGRDAAEHEANRAKYNVY